MLYRSGKGRALLGIRPYPPGHPAGGHHKLFATITQYNIFSPPCQPLLATRYIFENKMNRYTSATLVCRGRGRGWQGFRGQSDGTY